MSIVHVHVHVVLYIVLMAVSAGILSEWFKGTCGRNNQCSLASNCAEAWPCPPSESRASGSCIKTNITKYSE